MNKRRCSIPLLFFICFLPVFLQGQNYTNIKGETIEETSGSGFSIYTNPHEAAVFIDGARHGFTPASFDNIPPGAYSITLCKDGYKDYSINVIVPDNGHIIISVEMRREFGNIWVTVHREEGSPESLPFNPLLMPGNIDVISVKDSPSGEISAFLNLPAGYNRIAVRAFGWEDASESVMITEYDTSYYIDIFMKPAKFNLGKASQNRRRFNPKNPGNLGAAEYRFEVSAPGSGTIAVIDKNEDVVYKTQLNDFTSWHQSTAWNGRDSDGGLLPQGLYTVIITASGLPEFSGKEPEILHITLETEIDYSINIFPLSLLSGISGLLFTPLPHVLPAESFQIETAILPGSFYKDSFLSSLPLEMGLRASPLNRLEISANVNFIPRFNNSAGAGVTGAVKFNILNGAYFPLALAAGAWWAWHGENGASPFGMGSGGGICLPLSLELNNFSITFSSGTIWRGLNEPAPLLLLSGGVFYRNNWLNAGISMRSEFNFNEGQDSVTFHSGMEGRFYPPPSNLFFSAQAGMWKQGSYAGGWGGFGFGVIY